MAFLKLQLCPCKYKLQFPKLAEDKIESIILIMHHGLESSLIISAVSFLLVIITVLIQWVVIFDYFDALCIYFLYLEDSVLFND